MSNVEVVQLAKEMAALQADIDEAKKGIKDKQKRIDDIRFNQLPDAMDEQGIENLRVADVGTVYITSDLNVSLTDKFAAYDWLQEHGFGDLISDYVFPQTLKAAVKEQIKKRDGVTFPDSLFTVKPFSRAAIRRG
jgi:hypothetical protein